MKITLLMFLLLVAGLTFAQTDCGKFRWSVKTLRDQDTNEINFSLIVPSSVHAQNHYPAPVRSCLGKYRLGAEDTVFSIVCYLVAIKLEKDNDFHIVVRDLTTSETMICEIPSPDCPGMLRNIHAAAYRNMRSFINQHIYLVSKSIHYFYPLVKVKITGIGFFDSLHHQTGCSVNGRELHPVLSFEICP